MQGPGLPGVCGFHGSTVSVLAGKADGEDRINNLSPEPRALEGFALLESGVGVEMDALQEVTGN